MRKKTTNNKKKIILGVAVLGLILIETVVLVGFLFKSEPKTREAYAKEVIAKCKDEEYRPSCYDKEIPKLMDNMSMEEAFEVTRVVQDIDREFAYCHVLGHELSAREVSRDPVNWKDVLARCPSGICSNGCLHGGLQEKFRGEFLTDEQIEEALPDFSTLCEKRPGFNPTGLEQGSCYHALGHLTMYTTGADIPKAIQLCDKTSEKTDGRDYRQLCYDGVFMQMFQPLDPEDFALVKGKQPDKNGVDEFCGDYDGMAKASCQNESWPFFRSELVNNPNNLVKFCSKLDPAFTDRCYNALFYVLTTQFNLDSDKVIGYCSNIIEARRGLCFANAASRMIETDYRNIEKAINLCRSASDYGVEDVCYKELALYSDFNFHEGSAEFYKVCNSLPEVWKKNCLAKVNS